MTIMPFERETSVTVAASSASIKTGYGSTFMTGFVDTVYVAASVPATTNTIVKITSSSTSNLLFTVVNPSTVGLYYRPRITATLGGTTAAVATHPTSQAVPASIFKERLMVHVASATGVVQTATVTMRINPLY